MYVQNIVVKRKSRGKSTILRIVSSKDIGVFLRLAIDILFLSAVMIFKAILFREASKDRVSGTHP